MNRRPQKKDTTDRESTRTVVAAAKPPPTLEETLLACMPAAPKVASLHNNNKDQTNADATPSQEEDVATTPPTATNPLIGFSNNPRKVEPTPKKTVPNVATMVVRQGQKWITIPPGKLGIKFSGHPPKLTAVSEDSPLRNLVGVGAYIVCVRIPSVAEITGSSEMELATILAKYSEAEGRILIFNKNAGSIVNVSTLYLKPGPTGLVFDGCPPTITKIHEDSQAADLVVVGQTVTSLVVPGKLEISTCRMSPAELLDTLEAFSGSKVRILEFFGGILPSADQQGQREVDEGCVGLACLILIPWIALKIFLNI